MQSLSHASEGIGSVFKNMITQEGITRFVKSHKVNSSLNIVSMEYLNLT